MDKIDGVKFVQGDIESAETQDKVCKLMDYNKADVVCSDAVPDFVGTRFVDHMNAVNLNNQIVDFCFKTLKPGGNLLMKIIMGPAEERL
jgi:23S rRNA (uridine2552-2'-O)-methyltransferase